MMPGMALPLWHEAQRRAYPYRHRTLGHPPSNFPPATRSQVAMARPHQIPASRIYYRMLDRITLGFLP